MANTQAICNSFRTELLTGQHNFGVGFIRAATTQDVFKGALYLATATINASTTAYTATGEVANSGSYVAGGLTFGAFNAPANTGAQAYTTPTASWSTGAGLAQRHSTLSCCTTRPTATRHAQSTHSAHRPSWRGHSR